MSAESESLMEVRGLEVWFKSRGEVARAVDGVSIDWRRGEILGIVGVSGNGRLDLIAAHADNVTGGNRLYYRVIYDIMPSGFPPRWSIA